MLAVLKYGQRGIEPILRGTENIKLPCGGTDIVDSWLSDLPSEIGEVFILDSSNGRITDHMVRSPLDEIGSKWKRLGEAPDKMLLEKAIRTTTDEILLLNMDIFFMENIGDIISAHRSERDDITVLIKDMPESSDLPRVVVNQDLSITVNGDLDRRRSRWVDLGCYILGVGLPVDIMKLARVRNIVAVMDNPVDIVIKGYRTRSQVSTIGNVHDVLKTQRMIMDSGSDNTTAERISNLSKRGGLSLNMPLFIGENVTIGIGCRFGPYVTIMDDVTIGEGVFMMDSIAMSGVKIGDECYIEGSIIGMNSTVEDGEELSWGDIVDTA